MQEKGGSASGSTPSDSKGKEEAEMVEESPGGGVVDDEEASQQEEEEEDAAVNAEPEDGSDVEKGSVVEEENQDWKNVIVPILPYIRFPIMTGMYFASNVFELDLLSSEDSTLIMQWQFTKKDNDALKYSTKIRVR